MAVVLRLSSATGSRLRPPGAALLLAAALIGATATGASAQSAAERIVTGWADGLRAGGAEVRWSGLAQTTGDDRLELRDLEIVLPPAVAGGADVRIAAPSLGFTGLAERAEGGFTARAIAVPRLTLTARNGDTDVRIDVDDIDERDVVQPRFVLPAIDPDHAFTSLWTATRAYDGAAAALASLGRVRVTGKVGADTFTATLDGLSLGGLGAGRLERLTMGALHLDARGKDGPVKLSIGGSTVTGYDFSAWRHLFDDGDYVGDKGDGVWRKLVEAVSIDAIAVEAGDGALTIGRIASSAKYLRQFDTPMGRFFDRAGRNAGEVTELDSLRMVLALFEATRNDGWSIDRLHLAGPELDHFDIARVGVGAFSGEGLADLTIDEIDAVTPQAMVRLGRFALRDLRLPDGGDLGRAISASASGAEIDPSSLIPTVAHVGLERLEVQQPGEPVIRLAAFTVDLDRFVRAIPTSVSVALSHFVVPVAIGDAEARKTLGRMGYDRLDFSAAVTAAWREAANEVAIDAVTLDIADMGRLGATARLTGIPRALFTRLDTAAATALGIRLAEASATYTDASAAGRILALAAEDAHVKPERMRRKLIAGLDAALGDVRDPARRKRIAAALESFVKAPKSLSVAARPKTPVLVVDLAAASEDPGRLIDLLDLAVTAGP